MVVSDYDGEIKVFPQFLATAMHASLQICCHTLKIVSQSRRSQQVLPGTSLPTWHYEERLRRGLYKFSPFQWIRRSTVNILDPRLDPRFLDSARIQNSRIRCISNFCQTKNTIYQKPVVYQQLHKVVPGELPLVSLAIEAKTKNKKQKLYSQQITIIFVNSVLCLPYSQPVIL